MNIEIRNKPGFANILVKLSRGETITAESDAMASMSTHLKMKAKLNGGLFSGLLKKIFIGETLFVNQFTCPASAHEAELVLTQPTPGDICEMELRNESFYFQPGAYIAHTGDIKMGVGYAGFSSWVNREGLFRIKAYGTGKIYFGAYGCIVKRKISGSFVVDTGHLVGYSPTIKLRLGLAGGVFSSYFGGEGIVSKLEGDGEIYLQTRSIESLANLTNRYL